jgi:NADH:ubiquinone oxidoreductase subunit 6 (subunit J)
MPFVSPLVADIMLWLMYITVVVAVVVTIVSVMRTLRLRTKDDEVVNGVPRTRLAWIVGVAFLLCLVLTFVLGSSEPVKTNGKLFTDTFWLKATDMFIYTSLILIIGCFAGVVLSRFRN